MKLRKVHRTKLGQFLMKIPRLEKHGIKHFSVNFGSDDDPFFVRVNSLKTAEHKSEQTHSNESLGLSTARKGLTSLGFCFEKGIG